MASQKEFEELQKELADVHEKLHETEDEFGKLAEMCRRVIRRVQMNRCVTVLDKEVQAVAEYFDLSLKRGETVRTASRTGGFIR